MVSLYNCQGRHKRVAKFKSWYNALQYIKKRWGGKLPPEINKNYYLKTTKS